MRLTQICLYPRGNKPIKLPFKLQTKIPSVSVLEQSFDFGKLTTLGTPGLLPLTLVN